MRELCECFATLDIGSFFFFLVILTKLIRLQISYRFKDFILEILTFTPKLANISYMGYNYEGQRHGRVGCCSALLCVFCFNFVSFSGNAVGCSDIGEAYVGDVHKDSDSHSKVEHDRRNLDKAVNNSLNDG